ncbi:hypothetical protein AB0L67_25180 [Streptomyces flaveolus]|uniref:hypothetical protein n=1 Tax=Streptomyces flaveolus TaxID=67297 RepID=UPI00343B3E73
MSERILSMSGSTDRFIVSDRPAPTLTDRYRPLPDGMNNSHITVVPAHQAAAGDVIVACFTDGPGTRHAEHVEEAFTADPRPYGTCPLPSRCQECEDTSTSGVSADRYLCLAPADDRTECAITFRNTPVAIVPADTAALFPPLDCAPALPDLFALDDEHGPYEALPVARSWGPWQAISVTRATAEEITRDLTTSHAGRHLTCRWLDDVLLIASDPRLRTEPGRPGHLIERGRDGRYLIGGLWPWREWPVEDGDSDD